MRGWSFLAGRPFGVEVRIHGLMLLVLGVSVGASVYMGGSTWRGVALWLLLVGALAVREVARAMVAAWRGMELKSVLLLPTGGVLTFASGVDGEPKAAEGGAGAWALALVGPLANVVWGLVLGGLMMALTPGLRLWEHPWMTPSRLLRSAVWVNLLLAGANLVPAAPLDGGRVLRGFLARGKGVMEGTRTAASLGQMLAFGLVTGGLLMGNLWLTMLGVVVLFGPQLEADSLLLDSAVDAVTMRDVMLRNFATISASETLEGALESAVHSLQDVFPVVRGGNVVGAVSRQGIVQALQAEGNGYVQGVMTRTLATAAPEDSLVKTLRRMMGARGVQMVPVVEGERVVGIITPQNLAHSMRMLNQRRRLRRPVDDRG